GPLRGAGWTTAMVVREKRTAVRGRSERHTCAGPSSLGPKRTHWWAVKQLQWSCAPTAPACQQCIPLSVPWYAIPSQQRERSGERGKPPLICSDHRAVLPPTLACGDRTRQRCSGRSGVDLFSRPAVLSGGGGSYPSLSKSIASANRPHMGDYA